MRAEVYDLLTRPRRTKRAIAELERRLRGLEAAMQPKSAPYDRDRVQSAHSDSVVRFAERISDISDELDRLRLRYLDELRRTEDAISKIGDENERSVLTMRYICGMRFEDIADQMHYGIDNVYRLHRIAVKRIQYNTVPTLL